MGIFFFSFSLFLFSPFLSYAVTCINFTIIPLFSSCLTVMDTPFVFFFSLFSFYVCFISFSLSQLQGKIICLFFPVRTTFTSLEDHAFLDFRGRSEVLVQSTRKAFIFYSGRQRFIPLFSMLECRRKDKVWRKEPWVLP